MRDEWYLCWNVALPKSIMRISFDFKRVVEFYGKEVRMGNSERKREKERGTTVGTGSP